VLLGVRDLDVEEHQPRAPRKLPLCPLLGDRIRHLQRPLLRRVPFQIGAVLAETGVPEAGMGKVGQQRLALRQVVRGDLRRFEMVVADECGHLLRAGERGPRVVDPVAGSDADRDQEGAVQEQRGRGGVAKIGIARAEPESD